MLYCWFWSYCLLMRNCGWNLSRICIYILSEMLRLPTLQAFRKKLTTFPSHLIPLALHIVYPFPFLSNSLTKPKQLGQKKNLKIKQWNRIFFYFNLRLYSSVLKLWLLASKAYVFSTICGNEVAPLLAHHQCPYLQAEYLRLLCASLLLFHFPVVTMHPISISRALGIGWFACSILNVQRFLTRIARRNSVRNGRDMKKSQVSGYMGQLFVPYALSKKLTQSKSPWKDWGWQRAVVLFMMN